jgi:sirohydrochlorin cobaltochelatase
MPLASADAMEAVVLFAHGARDPEWAMPFVAVRDRVRARRAGLRVELAYLEFMKPELVETIATLAAQGATKVTVFPVFMAQGGHLKHDVPLLIEDCRKRFPGTTIKLASAVGDVPDILDAIAAWIERTA